MRDIGDACRKSPPMWRPKRLGDAMIPPQDFESPLVVKEEIRNRVSESQESRKEIAYPAWCFMARVFPRLFAPIAILCIYTQLYSLPEIVRERVSPRAPIEMSVAAIRIEPVKATTMVLGSPLDYGYREKESTEYYGLHRRVTLVHTFARTHEKNGWIDVNIFLDPPQKSESSTSEKEAPGNGVSESHEGGKADAHPAWDFTARIFPWLLALIAFLCFYKQLKSLAVSLDERVRLGAPIEIRDIKVGAIRIDRSAVTAVEGSRPDNGEREKERNEYYGLSRRVMLVHTIARSHERVGWYDIRIFVIPHNRIEGKPEEMVSLAQVSRVEYYFGGAWGSQVFPSQDRISNFAVALSAYGPFLATAKAIFNDGQHAMLHRYVDIEMGDYAPVSAAKPAEVKIE
jgi:pYEATS domain-containing protein involved in immunity